MSLLLIDKHVLHLLLAVSVVNKVYLMKSFYKIKEGKHIFGSLVSKDVSVFSQNVKC